MQRRAALDIGLDVENQLLHGGLLVTVTYDLERLHHWNARRQHRCKLAREHRDVCRIGLAAALECLGLLADLRWRDALTAQLSAQSGFIRRETFALDA